MGKSLNVRFPDGLYDEVAQEAESSERSMGGQIRYVLGLYYGRRVQSGYGRVSDWKGAFEAWVEEGCHPGGEVETQEGTMMPIEQLLTAFTVSPDIMPGWLCGDLDIPSGSTWGEAALVCLGRIERARQEGYEKGREEGYQEGLV